MDDHFINLDNRRWLEQSKDVEKEFRSTFHDQLMERKQCHIWKEEIFCFCQNGDNDASEVDNG